MLELQQSTLQPYLTLPLETVMEASQITNVFQSTIEVFQEIFGVHQSLLLLFDERTGEKVCYDQTKDISKSLLTLCCQFIEQNKAVLVQGKIITWSETKENCSFSLKSITSHEQNYSWLIIPLLYQQSYLGELCLWHQPYDHQWTEEDLTIVRHLANQCASSIYHIQQLHHQHCHKQLLKQINKQLNSQQKPESVVQDIIRLVGQSFQVEEVLVLSFEAKQLRVTQEWILKEKYCSNIEKKIAFDEWLALLDSSSCQYNPLDFSFSQWPNSSIVQSKYLNLETKTIESGVLVSIPISIREKFFGVLLLQTTQSTLSLTSEDLETLAEISQQIAIAIDHLHHQDSWLTQQMEQIEEQKQHLEIAKKKASEFLDHTVHELRSPLTGILSFAQILQEQIYGTLNPKQSQYVDVIVASGQHMLSLVNDFLDLSKLSAHREEIVLESMAVADVCLASLAMVQVRAQESELSLELDIAPDVDFCKADQRRIKQILVNLLSNAIKFTEKGSVTLRVQRNQHYLEFSVIDTGIGIKPEDQKKLFQPFQQIKNHLSRKHKGTGLGLALSRQLAQLHRGDITLVSEEGKGSCFTLRLPI